MAGKRADWQFASRIDHDRGRSSTRVGRVKIGVVSRHVTCLFVLALLSAHWLVGPEPVCKGPEARIVAGAPGTATTSFALSPTGKLAATTDVTGRLTVRDLASGLKVAELDPARNRGHAAAFSPCGRFLATGGTASGVALCWLFGQGNVQHIPARIRQARAFAFSPDGRVLAALSSVDRALVVWDLAASKERAVLRSDVAVLSIAFSPDGRYLASGEHGDRPSIRVWEVDTGRERLCLKGSSGPIVSVAFSADGNLMASAARYERQVRLWDIPSGQLRRMIGGHVFGTNSVIFSPLTTTMATAGNDGRVRLWSVATGEERAVLDGDAPRMDSVAFSADGRTLAASSSNDNDIRLWNITEDLPASSSESSSAAVYSSGANESRAPAWRPRTARADGHNQPSNDADPDPEAADGRVTTDAPESANPPARPLRSSCVVGVCGNLYAADRAACATQGPSGSRHG
jgi:WD40 repeat protein